MNKKTAQLSLLFLLFSISVFIRLSELRSDLNRESEWQTAHVLTTLSIWESDGIAAHYFSPVWTFNTPADKFTNSLGGIKDKNNFTYYTSYPPFSFILPYVVFKLTGTDVSVNALRIFSVLIHFFCALLIFYLSKALWNNIPAAFTAYCIYLFSAGNLWFHGNFYFADSLVQLFVLGSLYVMASIINSPETKRNLKCSSLILLTSFGIYTEWLALLAAFIILILLWSKMRENKVYRPYFAGLSFAIVASVTLIIIQYSSIAGFEELKEYSLNKFGSRSGFVESMAADGLSVSNTNSFSEIFHNYTRHYNYTGALVLICLLLVLWQAFKKRVNLSFSETHIIILGVVLLSVALHHVLFFNFTAVHDISALKTSIFFSLFSGWAVFLSGSKPFTNTVVFSGLVVFIFLSSDRYKLVVAPGNDTYFQERAGKIIAEFNSPDEMIFTNIGVSPVMMWYSQRNPIRAENENECIEKMQVLKYPKGVFFKINTTGTSPFYKTIRLSAE